MARAVCSKPSLGIAPIAGVVALLCLATAAVAQPSLTFTEFAVARGSRPVIVAGPDGALWYSEFDRIGRITTDGAVSIFLLPDDGQTYPNGRGIEGLTSGPDGALWFTESVNGRIARITTDGVITEFQLEPDRRPFGITSGPDGALWYAEGLNGPGRIGRITTSGDVSEFVLPQPCGVSCDHNPRGITTGPDGALWFTNLGDGRVWRVTTAGVFTRFPGFVRSPGDITVGPDGALWLTGSEIVGPGDVIGRITTSGDASVYVLPLGEDPVSGQPVTLHPHSITTGPDDALWFTSLSVNQLGRLTTAGEITMYDLPPGAGGGGSVTAGPDGALWVAGVNAIVRASFDGLVPVDVRPGSCVNPINARSRGRLPVAIGGTSSIDVVQIDPTTVRLEGVSPLRWTLADVITPPAPGETCGTDEPDGELDLVLLFPVADVIEALREQGFIDGIRALRLIGSLKQEFGGAPVHGQDVVRVKAP